MNDPKRQIDDGIFHIIGRTVTAVSYRKKSSVVPAFSVRVVHNRNPRCLHGRISNTNVTLSYTGAYYYAALEAAGPGVYTRSFGFAASAGRVHDVLIVSDASYVR